MNRVIALPVRRFNARDAFKKARKTFPSGVGVIVQLSMERWLLAMQTPLSSRFLSWLKHANHEHRAYLESQGVEVFCLVIRDGKLNFAYLGDAAHVEVLLNAACREDLPSLAVCSGLTAEHCLSEKLTVLIDKGDAHSQAIDGLKDSRLNYQRLSQLQYTKPMLASLLCCSVILSAWWQWPKAPPTPAPTVSPEQVVENLLSFTPGKITPLLRLDYNLQTALNQLSGWHLRHITYRVDAIEYELERTGGSLKQLRRLSEALGLSIRPNKENWQATQAIQLPPPIADPNQLAWHSVEALTDWLDYQLQLWLPGAQLLSVPEANHGKYAQQRIALLLEEQYLPDLLTLAAILDELPVAIQRADLKRNGEHISGHIEIIGVGVISHG